MGLLGPNGAGKTTTFYMVVGLARPDSGQRLPRRRGHHGPADVPARPGRASATCRRRRASSASSPPRRTCSPSSRPWACPRPSSAPGRATLLEELGILAHGPPAGLHAVRGRAAAARDLPGPGHRARPSSSSTSPSPGIDPIAVIDIQKIIAHLQGARHRRAHHRPQRARDLENHGPGLYSQGRKCLPVRDTESSSPPTRRCAGSTWARRSASTSASPQASARL